MTALIDTNILLDVIQRRAPHDVAAVRVWALAETGKVQAYVSAISFNNVFYVASKQLGHQVALDAVKLIRKTFQLVPLDEQVIDQAIAKSVLDLEDAIQSAAAVRVAADYVVTRNVGDFAELGVPAVTAEEFLAILQP
jgi:predicted nucleic acid-binding protein